MNYFKKIVWSEGMFLTPHHFQQSDRYLGAVLHERFQALNSYGWGVSEMNIDLDGLSNGSFTLLKFRGVLQDGLIIRVPECDTPPETRNVMELFPPSLDHLDVYLGVPAYNPAIANCSQGSEGKSRHSRYTAEYIRVPDDNTGENIREVATAKTNLKLYFSGEEVIDSITIKIAELFRTPGGSIALRETYVPPCLNISASPYLMRMVRGLIEVLSARSSSLSGLRRGAVETGAGNVTKLLLFQTINACIPILSHINSTGKVHPESLYLILSRLAGELSSFSAAYSPRDIPSYHHLDIIKTFEDLDQKIRGILEGATPTQCTIIPLEVSRENVWIGRITDEKLLETAQFFFAAAGDIPDDQLREGIPRRLKAGSVHELDMIVSTAMPGVRLYHVPRPPSSIPVKTGYHYFRIENQGDFWNSICRSRVIAFYVPTDLKKLQFELMAARE